jgi:hypothetical protein
MKIFYKKENGKFAGAGCIEKLKQKDGSFKQELSNESYDFIETEGSIWFDFQKENRKKQIYVRNGKLEAKEIEKSLDELKRHALSSRKNYRKKILEEWFDDLENMPQDIRNNCIKAKREIKEIEAITNKKDLIKYKEV